MKRSLVLLILFFQFAFLAEGQVSFKNYYNFYQLQFSSVIVLPSSGGYVVSGTITRPPNQNETRHNIILKIDIWGNVEWSKEYFNSDDILFNIGKRANDGGFALWGTFFDTISGLHKLLLVKTDSIGNFSWAKGFGNNFHENTAISIYNTFDNGFVLASFSNNISEVIKTDPYGDTLWTKSYLDIIIRSILQASDSTYLLMGIGDSVGVGNGDAIAVKIDSAGNILWAKSFHTANYFWFQDGVETYDGGYLFLGNFHGGSNIYKTILIKTDVNGDSLWTTTFDSLYCQKIIQDSDSEYVILGYRDNSEILVKVNCSGSVVWANKVSNLNIDLASVLETNDNGYIIINTILS